MRQPLLMIVILAAGCGGGASLDHDMEKHVTISRGVYGQTLGGCDTLDCDTRYYVGCGVAVFTVAPKPGDTAKPVAQTLSSALGFYQIGLTQDGTYTLCAGSPSGEDFLVQMSCSALQTSAAQPLVRYDFMSGLGGGNWSKP
jgi:hypothetical protein